MHEKVHRICISGGSSARIALLICRRKAAVEHSTSSVVITCRMTSRGFVLGAAWPLQWQRGGCRVESKWVCGVGDEGS